MTLSDSRARRSAPLMIDTDTTDELPVLDGTMVDLRCSIALIKNDEILLLHRTTHPQRPYAGDWVLPGGHPSDGESMHACAVREAKEETGLSVELGRCLFVYEIVGPGDVGRRVELVFSAAARSISQLSSREDHRHPEFVPLAELPRLNLRPPLSGHLRGLRAAQPPGAAYLGNLWRPHGSR